MGSTKKCLNVDNKVGDRFLLPPNEVPPCLACNHGPTGLELDQEDICHVVEAAFAMG